VRMSAVDEMNESQCKCSAVHAACLHVVNMRRYSRVLARVPIWHTARAPVHVRAHLMATPRTAARAYTYHVYELQVLVVALAHNASHSSAVLALVDSTISHGGCRPAPATRLYGVAYDVNPGAPLAVLLDLLLVLAAVAVVARKARVAAKAIMPFDQRAARHRS
jgi:hypothetical protein